MLQTASAQTPTADNSPYTRFGLGDLYSNNPVASLAQAGTAVTWSSPYAANFANPAALGSLNLTAYDIGVYGRYSTYSSANANSAGATAGLNNFSLAFPIFNPINEIGLVKKRVWHWGMGVGISPYAGVDYNITEERTLENIGTTKRVYSGSGGMYQLQWANGFRYKNIQAGLSLGYLFGKTRYRRDLEFQDLVYIASNRFEDNVLYSGATIMPGVQYDYVIDKKKADETDDDFRRRDKLRLVAGATANIITGVTVSDTYIYARVENRVAEIVAQADNEKLAMTMPTTLTGGLRLQKDNNWSIAAQYETANWSVYQNPLQEDQELRNAMTIRLGGEWTPNYKAFGSYWSRVSYRAGVLTATDPRVVKDEQMTNKAVTFGVGLPVRLPRGLPSFVNIGVELGEQGTPSAIKQSYTKLTFGVSLNDNTWFLHRKFD